jgi:hypothetical protein
MDERNVAYSGEAASIRWTHNYEYILPQVVPFNKL